SKTTNGRLASALSRVVECPYEEYGPYLPEGHPDKKVVEKDFKFGDIITDEEVFFEYKGLGLLSSLATSGFRAKTSVWANSNQFYFNKQKLRKCTEEETQWYNKCKEVNKFIPKEE